jgi:hypothetical protein
MARPLRLPNVTEQAVLDGVQVRLITPEEPDRWNQLIASRHYLKNARLVGEQLRYVAEYQGTWLALLGWSAPAFHLQARDAWVGWSPEQRRARRHLLAQNSRFLILADRHQWPNLASRVLALNCARLSEDWRAHHGHPIVAVESFVDAQITRGTAYKASGWILLGPTAGFGRHAQDFYERHDRPKQLWVRALDPAGPVALQAPALPAALAAYERSEPARPASARCRLPAPRLPSLLDRLPQIPDPRGHQGRWHPWRAVLGILALAKLAGVPGAQRDVADFADLLTQPQRRHLGCRRDSDTRRYTVPGPSTFFRALASVDYLALEAVVLGWQHDVLGPVDPHELVVLDGKTIVNAQGQVMVSAVSVPSGRVYGVEPVRPKEPALPAVAPPTAPDAPPPPTVAPPPDPLPALAAPSEVPARRAPPKKENEIPAARRLLERAPLVGRLVSLDALHTQHETAAQLVVSNGADYLFTLKANQEGLLQTAQTLVPGAFFPAGPRVEKRAHRAHRGNQSQSRRNPPTGHPPDCAGRTGPAGRGASGPAGQGAHHAGPDQGHATVADDQPGTGGAAAGGVAAGAPGRMGH